MSFTNRHDRLAFEAYSTAIETSSLPLELEVPRDISRKIAELATGSIIECGTAGCTATTGELYGDKRVPSDTPCLSNGPEGSPDERCNCCGKWRCEAHKYRGSLLTCIECRNGHTACCEFVPPCGECGTLICTRCAELGYTPDTGQKFCTDCTHQICNKCWRYLTGYRFYDVWCDECFGEKWYCVDCRDYDAHPAVCGRHLI